MLIGEDGSKIGNVTIEEAEKIAKEAGKDLTMKSKDVYRIADEGRLRYERNKKQKQQRAQRRTHKVKEIKLGLLTEAHDIGVKSKHIREFLEKGLKTKVTMRFKGRQMAFKSAGLKKMNELIQPLVDAGVASIDKQPKFEGRNLVAFLIPPKV